jgi:hypothetical protein
MVMKKNTLFILFLCSFKLVCAQDANFLWVKQFGGTGTNGANSMELDASGNIYTIGVFSGTVDFNPGSGIYNLTSIGDHDIFVSKLDSAGNFIWAKQIILDISTEADGIYFLEVTMADGIYRSKFLKN